MTKKELRAHWLEHRLTLSESQKNQYSFQIQDRFFEEFSIPKLDVIHIFLPVHEKCEVRTWNILFFIKEKYPHVDICVPRISNIKERTMDSIHVESHTTYVKNKWGIDEPETGSIVPPSAIDLILLPLITFDKQGHRLGYGGGFYDRYLPSCTKALKVGLSYFEPVEVLPETGAHDVAMNYCVTPEFVYKF